MGQTIITAPHRRFAVFTNDSMPPTTTTRTRPSTGSRLLRVGTPALLLSAAALFAGCVSQPDVQVVRSLPPSNPSLSITNYFDLTVKPVDRNRELVIGTPQRGACPMGGSQNGYLGWVVPVEYKTRSKDNGTVIITSYFFWFSDEAIRGVTRRMEVCP